MLPEPIEEKKLNIYGDDELPWSRVQKAAEIGMGVPETAAFLATVGSDNRPHSTGIGAIAHNGYLYFTSGPGTRKSRNLAVNPACAVSFRLPEVDLVLEGAAQRVTDIGELDTVSALYHAGGWPAERAGDAITAPYSAQSAGPAPWHLFRFTIHTAVGVALADPHGATHWRFT